jgi:hypothetical protein
MKRAVLVLGFAVCVTTPAAGQWTGMPAWNSPKGGTGVTISGDWGKPNELYGKGNAFGARASLTLATMTFTAGVASYGPEGLNERTTSLGGQVDFRVIGGSLLPIAVNVQAGAGVSGKISSGTANYPKVLNAIGAVGFSAPLPTPGLSIEPYFSPGIRYRRETDALTGASASTTKFGYVLGANIGLGMMGIHAAYDYQGTDVGDVNVFGLGAHFAIRMPLGM